MNGSSLRIVEPGLLTAVQDRGRFGWEHMGIVQGGALDRRAYIWANRLALNDEDAAVLEMTLLGATVAVTVPCWIATTGASRVLVDGTERPGWAGFWVGAGSTVEVKGLSGARAYLAVNGGISTEPVLGSRSTNLESGFGGLQGRALRKGDELPLAPAGVAFGTRYTLRHPRPPRLERPLAAAVVLGPREAAFGPDARRVLLDSCFRMSPQSNHMGLRLEGPPIPAPPPGDRISEPMPAGGIQVTPAGQPIVLLNSRGTIGGYPLLATVSTSSLWELAQARPGDDVRFYAVTAEEARAQTIKAATSDVRPVAVPL